MRIGIHGKDFQNKSPRFILKILSALQEHRIETWVSDKFLRQVKTPHINDFKLKIFDHGVNLRNLDFFLSLGGDGTLLESVTYIGKAEVPILGINTGRLGFLATISRDETEKALDVLFKGNYKIDTRAVLKLISTPKLFGNLNFGLNDFTIIKKDTSSMITVHVHVDGELLNSYWSDGIILSTPTGSTGYSLSCVGPLAYHTSTNFILNPLIPHHLWNPPIVLSHKSEIS